MKVTKFIEMTYKMGLSYSHAIKTTHPMLILGFKIEIIWF